MPLCADALSLIKGVNTLADGHLNFDTKLDSSGLSNGLGKLGSLAKSACKTAAASIATAGTALAGLAAKAVQVGSSFESSMSQVAATMGITAQEIAEGSKDYEILAQAAKAAGASTKYSATQAADALNYLALAGYDASTAADVLPSVLNLAAASGMELAAASDLATDAMSALGIAASNENLTAFGDKLAKTASKSNTSVSQLGEAILTCAGTAKGFGMSAETLAAELGVLANRGLKSSEAGTHLRNVILSLESPTDTAADEIERLGLATTNADGSFRNMNDIVYDLNKSMSKLTDEQRAKSLSKIFNKTDLEAVNYLMAGLGDEFDNLYDEVSHCGGAMQNMADVMNDKLQGQVTILQSSLEGLGIQVYESIEVPLKGVVSAATEAVGRLSKAFSKHGFSGLTESIGKELAKAAAKIAEYAPKLADMGTELISSLLKGFERNSGQIAKSAAAIGKSVLSGIVRITPQIAAAGMEILAALAKSLLGNEPAKAIKTLSGTIKKSFKEITTAVKSSVSTIKGLLGNLITIAAKVINAAIKPLTSAIVLVTKHSKLFVVSLTATVAAMKAMSAATALTAKIKTLTTVITKSKKAWAEAKAMMALMTTAEDIAAVKTALMTGSLTAQEVVVGVITGKIKLATLAQAAWNAVTAANPFVLAAAALAALGAGIAAYCLTSEKAKTKTDEYLDSVMDSISGIESFSETLENAAPSLASYGSLLSASGRTIADIDDTINTVETNITNILSRAIKDQKSIRDEDIDNIRNYTKQLYDLQQEKLELYRSQQTAELRKIELEAENITAQAAAQHLANLQEALDQSNRIVEDAYTAELTLIENKNNAGLYADEAAYKAALDAAKKSHDDRLAENQEYYNNGYTQLQEAASKWTDADAEMWQKISRASEDYVKSYGNGLLSWRTLNFSILKESQQASESIMELFEALSNGADESASQLLEFALTAKNSGQDVSDSVKESTNTILTAFDNLPDSLQESGKDILLGLIKGMVDEIPELEDTSKMTANDIADVIREYLGIHSPSRVMAEIGGHVDDGLALGMDNNMGKPQASAKNLASSVKEALSSLGNNAKGIGNNLVTGLWNGIADKVGWITGKIKGFGKSVIDAIKGIFGIHSPSKVMAEIGSYLSQGLGIGFGDTMPKTQRTMLADLKGLNKSMQSTMSNESGKLVSKAKVNLETGANELVARMKAAIAAEHAYTSSRGSVSNYNNSVNNYNTNTSTTNNQTLNFNQPIQSPSQVARAARKAWEVN